VELLKGTILGPNQIMKNVKPMPATEKILESRTVVTRDLLPPAKTSMHDIEEALHHEGHENSDSEEEEEYAEDDPETLDDGSLVSGNPDDMTTTSASGANPTAGDAAIVGAVSVV
jgi:hypothetical protein